MTRAEIIHQIAEAVLKDRQATHGNPEDSFGLFAELVGAYLKRRGLLTQFATLQNYDCAAIQALLKIARIALNPNNIDSWTDLGGYAVCGGSLIEPNVNENTMGTVQGSIPTATESMQKGVMGTDYDGPMANEAKTQMIAEIINLLKKKSYNQIRAIYVDLQP